ncbi:MAG: LuxR C-terminal-related transcriptional regulator, partial [Nitriliruptorales bacterium]|nr:LuxR C-terminal-related transcriptional regulator [Nitriliruptorales bacterium]
GLEELRAALGTDVSPATAEPIARAYTNLVTWLVELRRWEEVEETVAEATEFFADHDLQAHHINTLGTVAWMHLLRGDWEAAEELMDALDEGEEGVLQVGSLAARALIAVRRGDDDAENRIHTAWDLALGSQSPWLLLPTAAAAVEFAWTKSDRSIATPFLERTNDVRSNRSRDWVDWRLHVLFDEQADPKQLYHATERASVAEGWRAGAEMWSSDGMPYEQALELIRSAEVDATLDGLAILDRLGAEPAATIARHRLRELGVKSIPRGPQASTRENPMGLTDRQVDVLQLLVEGLTNAEIAEQLVVSVRTVDHHVSAILQKLRVDSRQEAVEVAASFGAS